MKNLSVIVLLFVSLSIGLFSGCTQQQTTQPTSHTITIQNFAFNPSNITVKVGANVTWINEDTVTHQVKEDNGLFLSNPLANGQSFTYSFTSPGIFHYICNIHPSMKGTVIVE